MPPTLFDLGEPAVRKSAEISPCGLYRYLLTRTWDDALGRVNFIMLNPSTADAAEDDPTIRRCIGFARSWGYGGLVVTNLYAYRATDPREMKAASDPIGPGNNRFIADAARRSRLVVCAWGNHASGDRASRVLSLLWAVDAVPHALKMTSLGQPSHPLYLPADLKPLPMEVRRCPS